MARLEELGKLKKKKEIQLPHRDINAFDITKVNHYLIFFGYIIGFLHGLCFPTEEHVSLLATSVE
jgi:high-affinity nickel permease